MENFLFVWMLVFSVFVSLSSSSWLVCWMMMEISSFFFVPLLFGMWSLSSVVASLKYFLAQSIGSSIFLFSILTDSISLGGWEWDLKEKEMSVVTCLSMMLKLGIFPFSGWIVHMSENLSWKKFFLLTSIQEVIPLLMISKFGSGESVILFFMCVGVLIMVFFCFCSYSIHWMMMISSLFNVSWMVIASLISKESLMFFFLVYFSTLYVFFWVLEDVISIGSLAAMSMYSFFKGGKVVFLFTVFMIMGIPPLGSFLGKVEVLEEMIFENFLWLSVYMLLMSSIFMFLYLKICLCISLEMKGGMSKVSVMNIKLMIFSFVMISFLIWMFCF